jgi:thioredoxin domain-containing protein 10
MRMSGSAVQQVTRIDSFEVLKGNNPVFFTYVGKQDGALWETYYSVAETFQAHSYFYATSTEIADRHFEIDITPAILVYKEKVHYYYPREYEQTRIIEQKKNELLPFSVR